ncbi:MAG: two-component system, NarL family, sensor kinase [Thermoleophilaceae bacterium]|jgi:two-component system NarL family sensor kinase|nr:two-component system, NarL family, sensor kinase [Thermoleophilaceae bacterium]
MLRRRLSRARSSDESESVGRALLKFAAAGLVALIVLGAVGALALARLSRKEAVDDAKQVTQVLAHAVVEPALARDLQSGNRGAFARLDRAIRTRVLRDPVVRVKIWTPGGRVVYSDRRELVGATYPLGADDRRALLDGRVDAEVSDLSRPENRFERSAGKLLEVYLPIQTPDGKRLLFETYQRYSAVTNSGRELWGDFLPALIGALLVFELVQLPLAWSLARRLQRGQREREALLRRALESSDLERRRIARDLHDGIVQDLVAASYSLAAVQGRVNGDDDAPAAEAVSRAAAATRGAVGQLRSLLVEIYPPRLRAAGLGSALADLVEPLADRGLASTVKIGDDLQLPENVEALFFRVAQEGVRNAAEHAGATHVRVRVEADGDQARMSIEDDGKGFVPEEALKSPEEGHFGLRLLRDLAEDAGATFTVESAPGQGTTLRVGAPIS